MCQRERAKEREGGRKIGREREKCQRQRSELGLRKDEFLRLSFTYVSPPEVDEKVSVVRQQRKLGAVLFSTFIM